MSIHNTEYQLMLIGGLGSNRRFMSHQHRALSDKRNILDLPDCCFITSVLIRDSNLLFCAERVNILITVFFPLPLPFTHPGNKASNLVTVNMCILCTLFLACT